MTFAQDPQTPNSLEDLLLQARTLASLEESPQTWQKLCGLLDSATEEQQEVLVEYLLPHTEHWNDRFFFGICPLLSSLSPQPPAADKGYDLRWQPEPWLEEMLAGIDAPKFGLLRVLMLYGKSLPSWLLRRIVAREHLTAIRSLYLENNKPPGAHIDGQRK